MSFDKRAPGSTSVRTEKERRPTDYQDGGNDCRIIRRVCMPIQVAWLTSDLGRNEHKYVGDLIEGG